MSKPTPKGAKKSKIVVLQIPKYILSRFVEEPIKIELASPVEKSDESTPLPQDEGLAPPADKKKKPTITGKKRAPPSIDPNAPPRERARPGPKKKPRLPDGSIDRTDPANPIAKKPLAPTTAAAKLGPKANTGAINAGLRALDRSGKPCRKWARKPLQIKSFTGVGWGMPSWKAPIREVVVGESSEGSSEVNGIEKGVDGSSVLQSERSVDVEMGGMASSPAPDRVSLAPAVTATEVVGAA